MMYTYQAVARIPKVLSPGVVYHNVDFELAALLCACGCSHRISLLVPDGHQISVESGVPTISPSILVADAPCHSHYYITEGAIDWCRPMSPNHAAAVMSRQVGRHVSADLATRTAWERGRRAVARWWNRVAEFLGLNR